MTADPGFVHLHVHSAYSLLEGALTISKLAEFAKADHQPALALTDTDNMFGALEFSEKLAAYGIQPIVGCALAIDFGDEARDPRSDRPDPGFAADRAAGRARRRLPQPDAAQFAAPSSKPKSSDKPHLKLAWLEGATDGLIALTGGPGGPLDAAIAAGQAELAASRCATLQRLFGDRLYIELQRHGTAAERAAEPALIELAYAAAHPAGRHQRAVLRPARGL